MKVNNQEGREMQVSQEEQQLLYSLRGLTSASAHGTLRIEVRDGRIQMMEETKRTLNKK